MITQILGSMERQPSLYFVHYIPLKFINPEQKKHIQSLYLARTDLELFVALLIGWNWLS